MISNNENIAPQHLNFEDLDIGDPASKSMIVPSTSPKKESRATHIVKNAFGTESNLSRLDILLHPSFVLMLEFSQVVRLSEINKYVKNIVKNSPAQVAYWRAMCVSFSGHMKIYTPLIHDLQYTGRKQRISDSAAKKHFYTEIWSSRKKWANIVPTDIIDINTEAESHKHTVEETSDIAAADTEFKIRVSCRFRPGKREEKNMNLPLHQFLKLRRKENKKQKALENYDQFSENSKNTNGGVLCGAEDPIAFIDPFLNVLMREPVLLTTANKVCERAVAVQCVLRNQKCPFTGFKLTLNNIIPQDDLKIQINEWRETKAEQTSQQLSINQKQIKANLIESNSIDPDLLDILQEIEKLSAQADKTVKLSRRSKKQQRSGLNDNDDVNDGDDIDDDEPENNPNDDGLAATINDNDQIQEANTTPIDGNSNSDVEYQSHGFHKSHEKPRLIDVNENKSEISMHIGGAGVRSFHFSNVFDGPTTASNLHDKAIQASIGHTMNGFNSCILCYGQTGSGKTHTFFGPDHTLDFDTTELQSYITNYDNLCDGQIDSISHKNLPNNIGFAIRTCIDLLIAKKHMEARGVNVSLTIQYIEIYEEIVTDLMTGDIVNVARSNGNLINASEVPLIDVESMVNTLQLGQERKHFAATAMNERSSRSHTAIVIQVTQVDTNSATQNMIKSQLHLVDLAGSERVKKSKVTGTHMNEAIGINSSLLVLGKCIAALVESATHVPYLESKLTTMLRAAFGGNSRTTAIVCGRSDDNNGEETLQSLRFGERCSMISNKAKALAQSAEATLEALNNSLHKVQQQLNGLESRGKSHLPSFAKLQASCTSIMARRDELAITVQKKCNETKINESVKSTKAMQSIANKESGLAIVKEIRYNADMIKTI